MTIETLIYLLIVLDAVGINIVAWTSLSEEYARRFGVFSKYLPVTRGWAILYAVLVVWLGTALWRLGVVVV